MPLIQEQHQQQKLQNLSYLQLNPIECDSIQNNNSLICDGEEEVSSQEKGNLLYILYNATIVKKYRELLLTQLNIFQNQHIM